MEKLPTTTQSKCFVRLNDDWWSSARPDVTPHVQLKEVTKRKKKVFESVDRVPY